MPIPSIFDEYYEQGLEQGLERGREQGLERGLEQGLEQMTATVLRARFGDQLEGGDAARIARLLLESGPEQALARIEAAASLDDLR